MTKSHLLKELADGITNHINLNEIRIIIASGADINGIVTLGLRPIHFAVYEKDYECVKLLLIRGCDVNVKDDIGYTPLHMASERGHVEIVKILVEYGAKVDFVQPKENHSTTVVDNPLRLAIKNKNYEVALFLLQHKADPNRTYFLGTEINLLDPIYDYMYMELLLRFGADPNALDRHGLNCLHKACKLTPLPFQIKQVISAIELLVNFGADVNAQASEKHEFKTPLHFAIISIGRIKHLTIPDYKLLCEDFSSDYPCTLDELTSSSLEVMKYLIENVGANINMPPDYIHPDPLCFAILKSRCDIVDYLCQRGAHINRFCETIGGAPLHIVCSNEIATPQLQCQMLATLLHYGADPNAYYTSSEMYDYSSNDNTSTSNVWSPLVEYLSVNNEKDINFVRILLSYGAQATFRMPSFDYRGVLRSLHRLNRYPDIFALVLENGQNFDIDAIRRRKLILPQHLTQLYAHIKYPCSLKHLTRLCIKNHLKVRIPEKLKSIPQLPDSLRQYLLCI